ncbi:telomere-associated protein Tap [Streptomyces yaizuensis]|uniref:Helix-turn-helix domain-containing protein n=1 Tax=Streptomyces yaizuensis TaxID=2989713 RepID=A0ABQ5NWX5_9ACTN|nr:helix-turn-helix transcriptional regulator [Streptomyces sp. YSPA8]GLF94878.1 helix-turn-helix domain-containing protein [Streptomyces sp. YSPA8]
MSHGQEALFARVDALLARPDELPPPAERKRLREAAKVTQQELAEIFEVRRESVRAWEAGRSEPKAPKRQAYARLLEGWSAKYPAPTAPAIPAIPAAPVGPDTAGAPAAAPAATPPAPTTPATVPTTPPAAPTTVTATAPAALPVPTPPEAPGQAAATATAPATASPPPLAPPPPPASVPATAPASRTPAPRSAPRPAPRPAPAAGPGRAPRDAVARDPRFPSGPLAVLDGDGTAHTLDGTLLDCPATTVPELVEWTLAESGLGAPRLHRHGKDADPLVVLTASAAERLGLPAVLEDRRGLRLPPDHPVVKEITRAKWKLTQRGFGPWPRVYRPATTGGRQCVQLAVLPWGALDSRAWADAAALPPADLARALGLYATRVLTPRGSTAVSGLELMTALRPPTRPAKDGTTGAWVSAPNPGALTRPVDPAPPEAPAEHPVAQGWPADRFLDEEAYQWVRDPALLSDAECLLPYAVGLDINTAFLAAASRLPVGLGEAVRADFPAFDPKIPGSWLVDLSHVELDPRLPSPFTPTGARPEGPAWYTTQTVAYAVELGADVRPLEGYLRYGTGAFLDPWHDRLKSAYVTTMAELGVPVGKDTDERAFLAAMDGHKQRDPVLAAVLCAVKSTVKGGIGKLRERPQGAGYRDGERWPALERPTWRPDIRAAVIAKARVNMHRKMANTARETGLYPLAALSDCVVYPSAGPSPLDFLPLTPEGRVLPGGFRLGATPGLAKVEGVQELAWAVDLMEQGYNPARHIKGGDAVLDEGE